MIKYVTHKLVEQICQNLREAMQAESLEHLGLIGSHGLDKKPEIDGAKTTQQNPMFNIIIERLKLTLGSPFQKPLEELLLKVRNSPSQAGKYAEKNILKLLGETEI